MRIVMWSAALVGCAAEHELPPSCDELVALGPVADDEVSTVGAVPSTVLDLIRRPVAGTLEFYDDITTPAPAELVVTFEPSGDAVDYIEPAASRFGRSCATPHLRMIGSLRLEAVRRDGATPLVMVDPSAMVLAFGPDDAIAIDAQDDNLSLPDWLEAVASADGQFADDADYRTSASLVPWEEEAGGAYRWSILQSVFSVGARNSDGVNGQKEATKLLGFTPDTTP